MMLPIEGYEARGRITSPKHWLVKAAAEFGGPVVCRTRALSEKKTDCDIIFLGVQDENKVRNYLKTVPNVRVRNIGKKAPGVVADALCKRTAFEKEMTEGDTAASLTASPEGVITFVVKSPWKSDIKKLTDKWRRAGVKSMIQGLEIGETSIRIEIKPLQEDTEDLAKMARVLIDRGYYAPKRPERLTHDALATELGISKPTLEKRMRTLESLGIKSLFGTDAKLNKEDISAAWNALKTYKKKRRVAYVS